MQVLDDATAFTFGSDDGLTLAGTLHGSLDEAALPLVCLSGLTRNARDFDALARIVRDSGAPRPVVAFDYRGRGRSDYAGRASDYNVLRETQDVLTGLAHLGLERAVFLGTSRGALILHVMARMRADVMAGAILNDAGPRIEPEGLEIIRSYVGKGAPADDWDAAANALAALHGSTFPALTDEDFMRLARATHVERDGRIVADHDPALAATLVPPDPSRPLTELWTQFDALAAIPLMVVRGEFSTLLSRHTVGAMARRCPEMMTIEVPGQGHPPLPETPLLADAILAFCTRCDRVDA